MAEMTMQVTEKMNTFIQWAASKGQDEIMRMINERLMMLKEECRLNHGMHDSQGFVWNDLLEPSDEPEQWKHGGDCNKCRRLPYCLKKCRANKLLKKITTPFLYEQYLADSPEAAAQEVAGMTPEQLLKQFGIEDGNLTQ